MLLKLYSPKILTIIFDTQEELTKSFCRVQEYYESPEFKDKIFTLGQYRKWYIEKYGQWSYYTDWSGFNIPIKTLAPFNEGLFDPLLPEEVTLLEKIKENPEVEYIIATYTEARADVMPHEIAHAMFATNPEYRKSVLTLINSYDLSELKKHILELGYSESVLEDECHAYILESHEYLEDKKIKYPTELLVYLIDLKVYHSEVK